MQELIDAIRECRKEQELLEAKIQATLLPVQVQLNELKAALKALEEMEEELRAEVIKEVDAGIPLVKGVSVRQIRDFRVVRPHEIPKEYLAPNLKAIRAAKSDTIPGIEFFNKTSITVK